MACRSHWEVLAGLDTRLDTPPSPLRRHPFSRIALAEGEEVMDDFAESEALDAGLLAAAQAVEHYEIARYGTLRSWAAQLEMHDAVGLLEETLQEEKKTDQLLTQLAEAALNQKAA
jgi:ferritin-like metal-binding protein YciE